MFTIRDERGHVAGFAGRAIAENETPKYLFSPGFPRGKTLYRMEQVRSRLLASPPINAISELFVVEGLTDALRIESLGFDAVGILGANMTSEQCNSIAALAQELDHKSVQLVVHLFLDSDDAGKRGTLNSLISLLQKSAEGTGFSVDVIVSPEAEKKRDPDELLRLMSGGPAVKESIYAWACSPMAVLLASAAGCAPNQLDDVISQMPSSRQMRCFREVERRLDRAQWHIIFARQMPFEAWRGVETQEPERPWKVKLQAFLTSATHLPAQPTPELGPALEKAEENKLNRALHIAQSSTQRRELPVDEGSWDRLKVAIDATVPSLKELLGKAASLDEPMMAVQVPKSDGEFRLKALPCAEFLTLQQYILNELMRDYPEVPRFREWIPAVRYSASRDGVRLETTGVPNGKRSETVSFAYQIDMDVIGGRIPPRREGMFRPYFPCWQDFVAFIDRRVGACAFETYHVARLDIRKFYDSLPRSAVVDAILPCLRNALSELDDRFENGALRCAGLFLPKSSNPDQRAGAIVDWLCGQSFHYQYEDPSTGRPQVKSNGIPQGPDLSAYLANIALFPLDRALREMVEKLDARAQEQSGEDKVRRGGVYARYVDDMVIIAPTAHDLARLRGSIEEQLGRIGLDLSPKTEPLPAMTEDELREWLTKSRGAGLGVSGPFEGPPGNEPLNALEPLGDAGEIDRGKSLLVLHDDRLDSPETVELDLRDAVRIARNAHDLRHADLVKGAALLWRAALKQDDGTLVLRQDGVTRLTRFWDETNIVGDSSGATKGEKTRNPSITDLLVWLDGLHRILFCRSDRSPLFSHEQHAKLDKFRQHVAELVQSGLCEELRKLLRAEDTELYRHMLDLRCLAVFSAASVIKPDKSIAEVPWMQGRSVAKSRALISIANAHRRSDLLDRGLLHAADLSYRIVFHEAIARFMISEGTELAQTDPLEAICERFGHAHQFDDSRLTQIIALWLPNTDSQSNECAPDAAAALAQLTPRNFQKLLQKRKPLTRAILGGEVDWEGRIIPVPPAMDVPGLLGVTENEDRQAIRVEMREHPDGTCPVDLKWHEMESPNKELKWKRFGASLGERQLLVPLEWEDSRESLMLRWLATAFRSLAATHDPHAPASCPPTAGNILGPDLGESLESAKWNVLGFQIPIAKLSGWAFVRHSRDGLVAEAVPEQDDHLWRIGTALADRLGRIDSSDSMLQLRLQARAYVTRDGADWAVEAMLRFSLFRLRGRAIPPRQLARVGGSALPATIERVLKRLERFPVGNEISENVRLAHLFATLAEGRALHARTESPIDPIVPGGAVTLLIDMVRPQFRGDEELAQKLPRVNQELPVWAPRRRPALAFLSLSFRLSKLVAADPESSSDQTLLALEVGTRILAIEAQLRAQALEHWALLDLRGRENIQKFPPAFEPSALLHRAQDTSEADADTRGNVRFLFRKLSDATNHGSTQFGSLAAITPLGWAVILGRLVNALPTDGLPSEPAEWFKVLSTRLQAPPDLDEDMPWGGFAPVFEAWTSEAVAQTFAALAELDSQEGIQVSVKENPHFTLVCHRRATVDVSIPENTLQWDAWKIAWASVPGEPHAGTESFMIPGDDRLWFRWSETWLSDRLLSIGVVQPRMASLAGIPTVDASATSAITKPDQTTAPLEIPSPAQIATVAPSIGDQSKIDVTPHETTSATAPKTNAEHPLWKIEELQDKSWSRRHRKAPRHARVALFQWQVDESYRHPLFEACLECGDNKRKDLVRKARENPDLWNEDVFHESCFEHRRRRLLTAALRACKHFEVDILLLPEYSIRPDTVLWLKESLVSLAPATSIWAGTYRVAAGSRLMVFEEQPRAWSAVLPVILPPKSPGGAVDVLYRCKKYPSPAVGELFCPLRSPIMPVFTPDSAKFDARAHVLELICSENFLVTSPSNLLAMADAHGELIEQFGLAPMSKSELDQMVKQDIGSLATVTSLSQSITPPRLIHLIPAMTRRGVDYSLSGQANFLAAGVTTVFCNSAIPTFSIGQSCIIGHGGWGCNSENHIGFPQGGPYHGLKPGIYDPDEANKGRLGDNEQALVIADIDPVYSMEGKPRPQMLPPPLALVAHLPIIESWDRAKMPACACDVNKTPNRVQEMQRLAAEIYECIDTGYVNSMGDMTPSALYKVLSEVAQFVSHNPGTWLHKRAEAYKREHSATPTAWPPPCALDWLWVDLGDPKAIKSPEIEMPAYSNAAR